MRRITDSVLTKANAWLRYLPGRGAQAGRRGNRGAGSGAAISPDCARIDRPADRMISDRVQMLAGWTTAPSDQDLNCFCEGREVPLIRFPYPAPDHPDLTGFGTYLLTQDFLGAADRYLRTEIRASGKIFATVPLRFSPIARELARDFPLNQRRVLPPR